MIFVFYRPFRTTSILLHVISFSVQHDIMPLLSHLHPMIIRQNSFDVHSLANTTTKIFAYCILRKFFLLTFYFKVELGKDFFNCSRFLFTSLLDRDLSFSHSSKQSREQTEAVKGIRYINSTNMFLLVARGKLFLLYL